MFNEVISKFHSFLAGNRNEKRLSELRITVDHINSLEEKISALSDEELQAKTEEFKQLIKERLDAVPYELLIAADVPKMPGQIRSSKDKELAAVLEEILPEAFAVCREASKRVLSMRHFDVQLIGGIQLHQGGIAEMQTGEGKTLVCTLPAYLNALTGRGVHIVTVNDYLAKRDSEWMGKLYKFLGLSVGLVVANASPQQRKAAYESDICYGTNNEFGFDYLRDNMETSLEDCVQKDYYMAIVDEVDSILIDEARTPLIISGLPDKSKQEIFKAMSQLATKLKKGADEKDKKADYYVDEKAKNVILTEFGIKNAEQQLKVEDLWDPEHNFAHHLIQALKAKDLFVKDVDYIIKQDPKTKKKQIVIVDEFTGRLMEGRRWGDGLHQAVEAKENVKIQDETLTMASITFQNLFRLYPKLAGMTGTAETEAEEFEKIYNLSTLVIPTNKECLRKILNDVVLKTAVSKYFAVAEDIARANWVARPVLVGTTSIEKSEFIANILKSPQIAMNVFTSRLERFLAQVNKHGLSEELSSLNKKMDRPGNLAFSDLFPVMSELENVEIDENNIANFGLKKVWQKDEDLKFAAESLLMVLLLLEKIRDGMKFSVLNAKHHEKEASIIRQAGKPHAITIATNMAGRGTDIVLGGYLSNDPENENYEVVDKEAQKFVLDCGGLHVIGTERHESRRIDNQLRGRCARQGDPGSSKFFLSLEDNLMRIFGGDRIIGIMNMLQADEDLPIEAGMVSGAINNAQKKVESHNFDIRKHVLQYDDVINTQREVIYRERRSILEGADIHPNLMRMAKEHVSNIIFTHLNSNTPVETWFDAEGISPMAQVFETLNADFGEIASAIKKVENAEDFVSEYKDFESFLETCQNAILTGFEEKAKEPGLDVFKEAERQIMLHVIDSKWIEHIHGMDSLKEGIHLQSYGQKDPLIEYKKQAFNMFDQLLFSVKKDAVALLAHAQISQRQGATA